MEMLTHTDNLTMFGNYQLMTIHQQVELGEKMYEQIVLSGYQHVLYIETGISPLVSIMQLIERKKRKRIKFFPIKIPRGATELKSFIHLLPRNQVKSISECTSRPFLILDEYMDSGHTMKLIVRFLQILGITHSFKILLYMNLCQDENLGKNVIYSAVTANCFKFGVYPFENRLDYAPYFYHNDKGIFRKIILDEFLYKPLEVQCQKFTKTLKEVLEKSSFLNKVRESIHERPVADYVNETHLILYSLFLLEHNTLRKQFFWLLYDMQGPFWSPLPDRYHLSYWYGFESIKEELDQVLHSNQIVLHLFKQSHHGIAHQAAIANLQKHQYWMLQITNNIGGKHVT